MEDNPNREKSCVQSPVKQLITSFVVVILAGIACFAIFVLAGTVIFRFDTGWFKEYTSGPLESASDSIKYMIVAQDFSFFIVPAVIILCKFNPGFSGTILPIGKPDLKLLVLVMLLSFVVFPVISITGVLNELLRLPGWLSGLEDWIREREETAQDIVSEVLKTKSLAGIWFNIFLIAVLPAISEELIFRGVFQKILCNLFKSGNAGVWVTAFIFSAIHLQFYGFLPRFILGLIFGYLFLWSENLWLPVIAHFLNNAVPVVSSYAGGSDLFIPLTGKITVSQLIIVAACIIFILVIMNQLRRLILVRSNDEKMRDPNIPVV